MRTYRKINAICDKVTEFSLYITIFFLPASNRIAEISIGIGILAWIINRAASCDIRPLYTKLSIPIFAYLIINLLSLVFTTNFYISLRALIGKLAEYILIYFLAVETINTKERLRNMLAILLASAAIIAIDGVAQQYTKVDILRGRPMALNGITGPFKNQNDLGSFISLVFPISLSFLFFTKKNKKKLFMLVVSSILLACLIATYSRGAWVGVLMGVFAILFLKKKRLIPIFLTGLIILFFLLPPSLKYRASQIFNFREHTVTHRHMLWNTAIDMTRAHPITGQGVGTFMYNFAKYRPRGNEGVYYAHNCFLQIAAEVGLFGLAAFIWILAAFFYNAFNTIKYLKDGFHLAALMGLTGGLIAFLIHSAVDTNLYSLPLAMLFWISLGLGFSIIRDANAIAKADKENTPCPNR